jgi:hypothetical protein
MAINKGGKFLTHGFAILGFLLAAKGTRFKMIFSTSKRNKMKLEKFHRMLGYPSWATTKSIAKRIVVNLQVQMNGFEITVWQKIVARTKKS